MFFILPLAAVIALASAGNTRMFWLGFAVIGSVQFWSMGFAKENAEGHVLWETIAYWVHPKIVREVTIEVPNPATGGYGPTLKAVPNTVPKVVMLPSVEHYRIVAYCVSSAVLGMFGGFVALWLYARRHSRPATPQRREGSVTDYT
jgi:hypothetical protein